jgi:predicted aspartyl protease
VKWGRPFDPSAEANWVEATLEGADGSACDLILVVDPGTSETIIEERIAVDVGLDRSKSLGPARYKGASGVQDGYYVPATRLKDLGRTLTDFKIAACPFEDDLETDGLVGLDFLRNTVLTLDFKHGRILLED